MRSIWLVLTLVYGFSQQQPVEERKDRCTLQGRTVNALTGEPLGEVSLTLRALPPGTDSQRLSSDSDGRFSFEDMEPGSYILSADRYGSQSYGAASKGTSGTPLTLSPGQVLKDIEFKLTPLGTISGTVVDENGKPVPKISVSAVGTRGPMTLAATVTNDAGEFRFPGLAPGSYVVRGMPLSGLVKETRSASKDKSGQAEEPLLPTYYPSAADAREATPLEVTPGQELRGITIILRKGRLDLPPSYHVRGTVVSLSPDVSLPSVRLWLVPRPVRIPGDAGIMFVGFGGSSPTDNTVSKDGTFDLDRVQPGSYWLMARRGSETKVFLGWVQVDISGADVAGVVLRIGEPIQLPGTIRMEGQDKSDLAGVRIEIIPLDGPSTEGAKAVAETGNTFTLEDVTPARYRLAASELPQNAYVKSIRLGGRETTDSGLDLTEMQTAPPLEIVLSPNGATVEGTVNRDSLQPEPGVTVNLAPDPARPELMSRYLRAQTSANGKFAFKGVAPGEYRLVVAGSKAVNLTVREGEHKQADLTIPETASGKDFR